MVEAKPSVYTRKPLKDVDELEFDPITIPAAPSIQLLAQPVTS